MSEFRRRLMMAQTIHLFDDWIYLKKNFQATEKFEESIPQDGISEFEISFKNVVYSDGNQCLLSIGENIKEWKPKETDKYIIHIYCVSRNDLRFQVTRMDLFSVITLKQVNIQDTHIIQFNGVELLFDGVTLADWESPEVFRGWLEYVKTAKNLKIGSMEGTPKPNVFFNYIKYK